MGVGTLVERPMLLTPLVLVVMVVHAVVVAVEVMVLAVILEVMTSVLPSLLQSQIWSCGVSWDVHAWPVLVVGILSQGAHNECREETSSILWRWRQGQGTIQGMIRRLPLSSHERVEVHEAAGQQLKLGSY